MRSADGSYPTIKFASKVPSSDFPLLCGVLNARKARKLILRAASRAPPFMVLVFWYVMLSYRDPNSDPAVPGPT